MNRKEAQRAWEKHTTVHFRVDRNGATKHGYILKMMRKNKDWNIVHAFPYSLRDVYVVTFDLLHTDPQVAFSGYFRQEPDRLSLLSRLANWMGRF